MNLPNPPWTQENPVSSQPDFDDGVDEPTGKGTVAGRARLRRPSDVSAPAASVLPGGPDEAGMLRTLLGPALGVTPEQVDDLGVLLVAPMARGAQVSLR